MVEPLASLVVDIFAVAGAVAGLAGLAVAVWTARQALRQLTQATQGIEASIAAEVRSLNQNCADARASVMRSFPIHEDLLALTPTSGWGLSVDGQRPATDVERAAVKALVSSGHPTARTWRDLRDLDSDEIAAGREVVGFLNDLCQMLDDGTPGHFIFQQHHQHILRLGALLVPLIQRMQAEARWAPRVPSLVNRAAIYHLVRPIHRGDTVMLSRALVATDVPGVDGRHVALLVPMSLTQDERALPFPDLPGAQYGDYAAFADYYRTWEKPQSLPGA